MVYRFALVLLMVSFGDAALADDWPQWRQNANRTAVSTQTLGKISDWKPLWVRTLPAPDPAFNDKRLQFDKGYEPIILGKRLVVASNVDDSVTALNTDTGMELWKFYTNGPVRFAPVGGAARIFFGSDDGHVYCVSASDGELLWKFQAVPSERKLMGNRRIISVWPIRGGPVLKDDRVYFAAGVFPFEGVFVYCLEAATGKVIWINDSTGHIYGQQPHNTEALGGLAPQGYLLINPETNELVVPSSNAYPARFNLASGKLIEFKLPTAGRLPGGWFASTPGAREAQKLKRRGLLVDADVNQKRHEDRPRAAGQAGVRSSIELADQKLDTSALFTGLEKGAAIHSIIAGDGKLYLSTTVAEADAKAGSGQLYCFARSHGEAPPVKHWGQSTPNSSALPLPKTEAGTVALMKAAKAKHGYALAVGNFPLQFLVDVLQASELSGLVSVNRDPDTVATLRKQMRKRGQQQQESDRLHFMVAAPESLSLPPYFASLIVLSDSLDLTSTQIASIYDSLRPYGGTMLVPPALAKRAREAELSRAVFTEFSDEFTIITRKGGLEGSSNYLGDFDTSPDKLVKAPLGILWFDDQISHFKRSPQPKLVDGTMISIDKNWLDASTRDRRRDYRLLPPRFSDVYTGRELAEDEVPELRLSLSNIDTETIQPPQYRPKNIADRPTPDKPLNSTRINPITGETEPRVFPMAYGCDNGIDYGNLYTMRSATAAFYDKTNESGTINLSGPRSGCTNSIIPANGVLNVPYFFEGCTCSYPLPSALTLYSLPESHEQWTAWGEMTEEKLAGKIKKLGINLGAPGDRVTRAGTLWVDHPASGGPSPRIRITTVPEKPKYSYRHSVFMKGGDGHPWVAASGASGLESLTVHGLKAGTYRVVLTFCATQPAQSRFKVSVNDVALPEAVELAPTFHSRTAVLESLESRGDITIRLKAIDGETQLSGVALIRKEEE